MLVSILVRSGLALPKARKIGTTVFACSMLSTIPAIFAVNGWTAILLISVTTFGYTGYTANTLAFPADVFPRQAVASVWGLASMGSSFGGMLFGFSPGLLIGHYGYTPVFIGYGILPLIALFCILFLIGPLTADPRFEQSKKAA